MKFTASWLKDHLENFDVPQVLEQLPQIGLEVEHLIEPTQLDGFALAEVVEVRPHPDADKLRIARVRTKDGIYDKTIVCGAPNLRQGQITILAQPECLIPATQTKLKPSTIRGVESFGMLCSGAELGISADSEGILDLSVRDLTLDVAEVLGLDDWVITLETTPNRPDWAGVQGIARDLAASGCGSFIEPKPIVLEDRGGGRRDGGVGADGDSVPLSGEQAAAASPSPCPHFVGRTMSNITNKPAPDWMTRRLRAIGLRPISALVDITNYICFDRARPLHIYDADKISGGVVVRMAVAGETFDALDGKTYRLSSDQCVIADDERALALGGVMGGVHSSVTPETKNIFIESAWFDPARTARTARTLNIHSDSSYRFERGVDPLSLDSGCDLAAQMVKEICGGTIHQKVIFGQAPVQKNKIYFTAAQIEKRSGVKISPTQITTFLDKLGFTTTHEGEKFATTPPSWRRDFTLTEEENNPAGIAELTEEVVRLYGVDKIPETALDSPARPAEASAEAVRLKKARVAMAAAGCVEIISWSFQSEAVAQLFSSAAAAAAAPLKLANPISEDLAVMRSSLLGGLLGAVARNLAYGKQPLALFEAGVVFDKPEPKGQRTHVAAVRHGRQRRHWQGDETANLWQIKADMFAALAACGTAAKSLRVEEGAPSAFHPSKSGVVKLGTHTLGVFGELHPSLLEQLDITAPCVAFELNMDALPAPTRKKKTQKAAWQPYNLMPVRRDFAFVVDKSHPAAAIIEAAASPLRKIRHEINIFDLFEKDSHLGENKISITIEITLFPDEVLRDVAIHAYESAIIQAVKEKVGGALRG